MPRDPLTDPFALLPPGRFLLAARVTLAAAALVVAWGVFKPAGHEPPIMPWDKAEHFTAFFGLMLLSVVAFPRASLWRLGAILSVAGALVELIQATPLVNRDGDIKDWVADTIGILAVVGVMIGGVLRDRLQAAGPLPPDPAGRKKQA
jgi:VanZ family protein